MSKNSERRNRKLKKLAESGTLNPSPEKVADQLFQDQEFFDRFDILQVKYEMLRRVEKSERSASRAAEEFGFSRRHFYQIKKRFVEAGLRGLVLEKRGPKAAHTIALS